MSGSEWLSAPRRGHWRSAGWPITALALACWIVAACLVITDGAMGDDGLTAPAWRSSPYHRVQDGNGKTIPCRCVFEGQRLPLGTTVCMRTSTGAEIVRCDLNQNVTTWVPTGTPCEISRLGIGNSSGKG